MVAIARFLRLSLNHTRAIVFARGSASKDSVAQNFAHVFYDTVINAMCELPMLRFDSACTANFCLKKRFFAHVQYIQNICVT